MKSFREIIPISTLSSGLDRSSEIDRPPGRILSDHSSSKVLIQRYRNS